MPKSDGSLSAVVVSGGKQYRVAPGDQILVDRLEAEPGSSQKLGRVLLIHDGSEIKVGTPGIDGLDVDIKILAHRRGPRIESLRYKSKKRVRVHRGGRADLTAIEILAIGGLTEATGIEKKAKTEATTAVKAKPAKAKTAAPAEASTAATEVKTKAEAPAKAAPKKASGMVPPGRRASAPKTDKETK